MTVSRGGADNDNLSVALVAFGSTVTSAMVTFTLKDAFSLVRNVLSRGITSSRLVISGEDSLDMVWSLNGCVPMI
jgi:hypothetical protein